MTGTNDKLRSLFLALLMVVSVFGATIAFSGTAAAANQTPSVVAATEDAGDISIAFDDNVRNGTNDNQIEASDDFFVVYWRQAGTSDFARVNVSATDVTAEAGGQRYVIDNNALPVDDVSPASDLLVNVGTIRPETAAAGDDSWDTTPGNVTVDTSALTLTEGSGNFNSLQTAERVYQGERINFEAADSGDNTDILLENLDTGEILLDGATGLNSQEIVFDSDQLESGSSYRLTFDEDGKDAGPTEKYFNVTSLRLSAEMSEDGTTFGYQDSAAFDLSGSAIRGSQEDTTRSVAVQITGEEDNYRLLDYNGRGEFSGSFDLGNLPAGDYTVTVIDVQTGVDVEAGSFSVEAFPDADSASFGTGVVEDTRGDVARIPIELENADEGALATVSIGSKGETNYVTNVTVADSDGDGEVTLMFNTFNAGTEVLDRVFYAESGEVVDWRGEAGQFVDELPGAAGNLDRARAATLDATNYQMQVAAHDSDQRVIHNFTEDTAESISGSQVDDVGTLSLGSRTTESSQVWVAPAGSSGDIDLSYVQDNAGSSLTQSDMAANGETVVHEIVATGFEGAILNRTMADDDVSVGDAFLAEADGGLWSASFSQVDPEPNAPLPSFDVGDVNPTIFANFDENTFYVAVNLDEIGYDDPNLEDNELWNASFSVNDYGAVGPLLGGPGGGVLQSDWTYRDAIAPLETNNDNEIILRNQPDQVIRSGNDVTVAPGTDLSLVIDARDAEQSPFVRTLETTVGPDRTFNFETDLGDKAAGINFTATLRRGGTQLSDNAEYEGEIRGLPQATVSFDDQTVSEQNQEVTVASVLMTEGGFVAIHEGGAGGPVIGTSKYLESGQQSNVRVTLDENVSSGTTLVAMPHLDTNANNLYDFDPDDENTPDGPYTSGGAPVTDSATVTVERAPANFQVSGLSPADVTVEQGDVISAVEATIENTGEQEGTQTVEFRVGGSAVADTEVTLGAGESDTVTFEDIDTADVSPGSYTHGIFSEDDSATAVLTVDAVEPANFQVSGLSPTDVTVTQGDVIGQVQATVENTGEMEGTQTIEFRVGGSAVASQDVTLGAGDSTTVTFENIDTSSVSPGAYTHGVFSEDDSATAALAVEEPPTPTPTPSPTPTASPTPTDTPEPATPTPTDTATPTATATPTDTPTDTEEPTTTDSGDGGPGFGVALAVIALLAAALIAVRRRD
mgnify:CR=1 FL=1